MPFDPGRSGGGNYNNFHNYSNPYAPPKPIQEKKNKFKGLILAFVGIIVLGLVVGGVIFFNMSKMQMNVTDTPNTPNTNDYVEVEIFDVETSE